MKLQKLLEEKELKGKELAEKVGTDASMISRFTNYKCLPIPPMLEEICKALGCEIADIYEDSEIYVKHKKKAVRTEADFENYKVTVRLPRDAKAKIREALKVCGYKDVTYWIYRCYERLMAQYEIIKRAEKRDKLKSIKIKKAI